MSINIILLASIGIVSYLCFNNRNLFNQLLFSPYATIREKQWYRFLSSAWVHSDFTHLFVNLFVLYFFGSAMESFFKVSFGNLGIAYYLILFIGSVIIAHIPTYLKEKDNYAYASVGASGGVSGVLFAFILLQPLEPLYLYGIIKIPGIIFGVLYLFYSNYMSKRGGDNVNHDAHMFGALGGMLILVLFKPQVIPNFINQITSLF
ncbi:MAG: rhomboid family intramembrane serine protease [Bacteroidia bacterium]|nr:rhomboid family intramembrane serine protease [Bacteroidia bacterium]NNJ55674.1 rhomboid family intramembrane serine protease [Bacteroidia bacterium]